MITRPRCLYLAPEKWKRKTRWEVFILKVLALGKSNDRWTFETLWETYWIEGKTHGHQTAPFDFPPDVSKVCSQQQQQISHFSVNSSSSKVLIKAQRQTYFSVGFLFLAGVWWSNVSEERQRRRRWWRFDSPSLPSGPPRLQLSVPAAVKGSQ